jgi:hypothetical protein
LVSYFVPALLAYGQFFAFYFNVQFDVFVFAVVFPWVFAMLHVLLPLKCLFWCLALLSQLQKRLVGAGEG